MSDITSTIRYIADASQAIGTMRALAVQAGELNRIIESASAAGAARGIPAVSNITEARTRAIAAAERTAATGLSTANFSKSFQLPPSTVIDHLNNTLRTTTRTVALNAQGMEIFSSEVVKVHGNYSGLASAIKTFDAIQNSSMAQTAIQNRNLQGFNRILGERTRIGGLAHAAAVTAHADAVTARTDAVRASSPAALSALRATPLPTRDAAGTYLRSTAARQAARVAEENALTDARRQAQNLARRTSYAERSTGAAEATFLANDPALVQARARVAELTRLMPITAAAGKRLTEIANAEVIRQNNRPAPIPSALETMRKESPKSFNRLISQTGLGMEKGVFSTATLTRQGAENLTLTRDLERGTSSLRGQVKGLNGEVQNINSTWANGGREIQRYGGILSGTQNFFRQTANNLQKVVQWGLATTLVIGGIGLVSKAVGGIKTLDASLNQLSITAQLSSTQTKAVFNDLAAIAYATATPLQEMVKAADDIALATKRANQSTEDWQYNIKSLATSVGILTNITGLDTVKATDLLTATMKQLGLNADDLTSILNKVTAVAGGQANSISDVVAGLGVMAEAAKTASLSLDETIAVVQVLGQVTSKSAAEIATSFKNLVGSVDSPGGKKALAKYNIDTRDAEGNLKNILQLYEEINVKIRSGVIPAADVKDLVKGIAGGPRRAPDASALLANVGAIREAEKRSAAATNEALVANVKYLDTMNAKITQIQVKFQTFIQNSFGPALKDFIGGLTSSLSGILTFLSQLDSGVIQTGIGILTFLAAFKLLSVGLNFIIGSLSLFVSGLKLVNVAAAAGTAMFLETGSTAASSAAVVAAAARVEITALEGEIAAFRAAATAAQISGDLVVEAEMEKQIAIARTMILAREATASYMPIGGGGSPASKYSKFAGPATALAVGAGTGALLGNQLSGGNLGATVGGGLAGVGLSLLVSVPIPQVKLLGAALLAVGAGVTLLTAENKKLAQAAKATNTEVLTAIGQYNEAQASITGLTRVQEGLSQTYKALTKDQTSVNENVAAISDTVTQYAQNALNLKAANEALDTSYKAIMGSRYKEQIREAASGLLSKEDLKALQKQIYTEIFSDSNPELFIQDAANNITPSIISKKTTYTPEQLKNRKATSTQEIQNPNSDIAGQPAKILEPFSIDLSNLKDNLEVLKLFTANGKEINAEFVASAVNIDAIRTALQQVAIQEGEVGITGKAALVTFENWAATLSAIGNADVWGKQQNALLATQSILGEITSEQQTIGQKNIQLYQDMIKTSETLPASAPRKHARGVQTDYTPGSSEAMQKSAKDIFVTAQGTVQLGKLSIEQAKEYIQSQGLMVELAGEKNSYTNDEYALVAEVLGISIDYTSEMLRQKAISEEMLVIEEEIKAQKEKGLDDYASKMGDIQKQFLSGDITKKQRDSMFAGAKATQALNDEMSDFFLNLKDNEPMLDILEEKLSHIPGLNNLVGKTASQASEILNAYLNSMNLTAQGANGVSGALATMIAIMAAIPANLATQITIAVNTVSGQLTGDAAAAYNRFRQHETGGNTPEGQAALQQNWIKKQMEDWIKKIAGAGSKGTSFLGGGSKSGGGGSSPGKDVSQLDLPEELYGTKAEQQAYMKEAIKRARALQKTIPGATKEASNDVVSILKGTQNLLTVKGLRDDLLRKALEELAAIEKKRLEYETKADTIRRIRVGAGDFAAIANVPVNTKTGISLGGPNGPITVQLNVTGQILTPAQMTELSNMVAAAIGKHI